MSRSNVYGFTIKVHVTALPRLLGRGISPSQGIYLYTEHKHRINAQTSIPQVGFENTPPVPELVKIVHALS
jgi:hypothetical protein